MAFFTPLSSVSRHCPNYEHFPQKCFLSLNCRCTVECCDAGPCELLLQEPSSAIKLLIFFKHYSILIVRINLVVWLSLSAPGILAGSNVHVKVAWNISLILASNLWQFFVNIHFLIILITASSSSLSNQPKIDNPTCFLSQNPPCIFYISVNTHLGKSSVSLPLKKISRSQLSQPYTLPAFPLMLIQNNT